MLSSGNASSTVQSHAAYLEVGVIASTSNVVLNKDLSELHWDAIHCLLTHILQGGSQTRSGCIALTCRADIYSKIGVVCSNFVEIFVVSIALVIIGSSLRQGSHKNN